MIYIYIKFFKIIKTGVNMRRIGGKFRRVYLQDFFPETYIIYIYLYIFRCSFAQIELTGIFFWARFSSIVSSTETKTKNIFTYI